jgi:hypothetical protein
VSTGQSAASDINNSLLKALEVGEEAFKEFKTIRLETPQSSTEFFKPIKRLNLKTFSDARKKKFVKMNNNEIVLKAEKDLFGRMVLIAQKRNLNMKEVLTHSFGPIPWEVANCDGSIKKTCKAVLAKELFKFALIVESIPENSAVIIDGMSIVQKASGNFNTFGCAAEKIFMLALNEGRSCNRIDVVFDVYKSISIKSAERQLRGAHAQDSICYKNLTSGQKVQQWRKFLTDGKNKSALIEFLAKEWQTEKYLKMLGSKEMFVAYNEQCIKIMQTGSENFVALYSNHEEADTRMVLHAKNISLCGIRSIIVSSTDTDVYVLFIATSINADILLKNQQKNRTVYFSVSSIQKSLGSHV